MFKPLISFNWVYDESQHPGKVEWTLEDFKEVVTKLYKEEWRLEWRWSVFQVAFFNYFQIGFEWCAEALNRTPVRCCQRYIWKNNLSQSQVFSFYIFLLESCCNECWCLLIPGEGMVTQKVVNDLQDLSMAHSWPLRRCSAADSPHRTACEFGAARWTGRSSRPSLAESDEICWNMLKCLVGGLEHVFSIYWECHHPNWLIFFRWVQTTNQNMLKPLEWTFETPNFFKMGQSWKVKIGQGFHLARGLGTSAFTRDALCKRWP